MSVPKRLTTTHPGVRCFVERKYRQRLEEMGDKQTAIGWAPKVRRDQIVRLNRHLWQAIPGYHLPASLWSHLLYCVFIVTSCMSSSNNWVRLQTGDIVSVAASPIAEHTCRSSRALIYSIHMDTSLMSQGR